MFILVDVHSFEKKLDFTQPLTCSFCGRSGRYDVFISGNRVRLFFIPIFFFGKQYTVRTSCCGRWFKLDDEIGKSIERNQSGFIEEKSLEPIDRSEPDFRRCSHCGEPYPKGANYCANCGEKLN